jgi:hypothetical protein
VPVQEPLTRDKHMLNAEGDAADPDVVEGRLGLALPQRVDELDQVEHGRAPMVDSPVTFSSRKAAHRREFRESL